MIIIGSISFVVTSNCGRRSSTTISAFIILSEETLLITKDKIDCRFFYRIAVAQRLQPSPHLVDGMDIPLQDLFLQRLCHISNVLNWWNNEWHRNTTKMLRFYHHLKIRFHIMGICNTIIRLNKFRQYNTLCLLELISFLIKNNPCGNTIPTDYFFITISI